MEELLEKLINNKENISSEIFQKQLVDELNDILDNSYLFDKIKNSQIKEEDKIINIITNYLKNIKHRPLDKENILKYNRLFLEQSYPSIFFENKTNETFDIKTIWFDAWKYDKKDVLWRALIVRILDELKTLEKQKKAKHGWFSWDTNNSLTLYLKIKEIKRLIKEKLKNDKDCMSFDRKLLQQSYLKENLNENVEDLQNSLYQEVYREKPGDIEFKAGKFARATVKLGLAGYNPLMFPDTIKDISESIQRKKRIEYTKKIQFKEEFQHRFEEIIQRYYIKRNKRVVIFIDDLDRCLPEKALEVLEAIKTFLDAEGCIFVLGIDTRGISDILQKKYKDLSAYEYIEKIIQLSFQLPPIETDDIKSFIINLEGIDTDFYDPYLDMITKGIKPNPRKIKRFLNVMELQRKIDDLINPDKETKYLFSWDEISGNDDERLTKFLKNELKIEWAKSENINKNDNDKTITVSNNKKSLSLKLDDEENKVILKIDDGKVEEFTVKTENGKLNIYDQNLIYSPLTKIKEDKLKEIISKVLSLGHGESISILEKDEIKKEHEPIIEAPKDIKNTIKTTKKLERINLRGMNLEGEDLSEKNLEGADLSGANLKWATLKNTKLNNANLTNTILEHSDLTGAELNNAKLTRANLNYAKLNGAKLTNAKLNNAKLYYTILSKANLRGASLKDAEVFKADLEGADLEGADLYNAGLMGTILVNVNFQNARLLLVDFRGASFNSETNFNNAEIDSVTINNLKGSNWKEAKWNDEVYEKIKENFPI